MIIMGMKTNKSTVHKTSNRPRSSTPNQAARAAPDQRTEPLLLATKAAPLQIQRMKASQPATKPVGKAAERIATRSLP